MSGGNGLPCQPSRSSTSEKPRPLMVRARITVGWSPVVLAGFRQGPVDLGEVVAVDNRGRGRRTPTHGGCRSPDPRTDRSGRAAEPVDVDHGDEVGQLVVRGLVERLPDRALGHLAVTAQDPDPERSSSRYLPASATPTASGSPWPSEPVATSTRAVPGSDDPPAGTRSGGAGHRALRRTRRRPLCRPSRQRRRVALGEDRMIVPGCPARPSHSEGRPTRTASRSAADMLEVGDPSLRRYWTGRVDPAAGGARPLA